MEDRVCTDQRIFFWLIQFFTPSAAAFPVEKQAVNKYPPVGASQSSISPAQKTPGKDLIIRSSDKSSKRIPPAELIASSSGRGEMSGTGIAFIVEDKASGLEITVRGKNSQTKPALTPSNPMLFLRWDDRERDP